MVYIKKKRHEITFDVVHFSLNLLHVFKEGWLLQWRNFPTRIWYQCFSVMEYDKGLMDIVFTHLQIPFNEGRFMGVNLLFFFLLDLINFLKLKWWSGSWSWFFIVCHKEFIFMLMRNLSCRKILKYYLYVTNIDLWAPISRYPFIVQASISRCPLFHF